MLLEFKVGNFLSFKDVQTLRLAPVLASDENGTTYGKSTDLMFIYGANGSGKSNLVKAMRFARDIVLHGTSDLKVSSYDSDSPSYFEFVITIEGTTYSYGFELDLDENSFETEWLYILGENENTAVFEFDGTSNGVTAGIHDEVFFDTHFSRLRSIHTIYNYEIPKDKAKHMGRVLGWFQKSLIIEGSRIQDEVLPVTDDFIDFLSDGLRRLDTGIMRVEEIPFKKEEIPQTLIERIPDSHDAWGHLDSIAIINGKGKKRSWIIHVHNAELPVYTEIGFVHENGHVSSIGDESLGTMRIIQILTLLSSLRFKEQRGSTETVVIDEIECSVHTLVVREFIRMFKDLGLKNGQLISTTHRVDILENRHVDENCVSFIEKDGSTGSRLYTLRSFKGSMDAGMMRDARRAYLDGRMGAVPFIRHLGNGDDRC